MNIYDQIWNYAELAKQHYIMLLLLISILISGKIDIILSVLLSGVFLMIKIPNNDQYFIGANILLSSIFLSFYKVGVLTSLICCSLFTLGAFQIYPYIHGTTEHFLLNIVGLLLLRVIAMITDYFMKLFIVLSLVYLFFISNKFDIMHFIKNFLSSFQ